MPAIRVKRQILIREKCYGFIDAYALNQAMPLSDSEIKMIAWQLENSRSTPSNPDSNSLSCDSEPSAGIPTP